MAKKAKKQRQRFGENGKPVLILNDDDLDIFDKPDRETLLRLTI